MTHGPFDAVVVGAGGTGTAIAAHLARAGRAVALVDRGPAVAETTAMAAGIAMHVHPTAAGSRLALRSMALLDELPTLTGRALAHERAGSIKIARTAAHARIVADEIAFGRRLGVAIDPLDAREAHHLAPWLRPDAATAISIVRRDLHFEPTDLPRLHLDGAVRHGATVLEGVRVEHVRVTAGRVDGVATTAGTIDAPVVVLAAGAWTPALAAPLGVQVPSVPVRHELFVTAPIAGVDAGTPHVRVMDANAYARPYRGGLMFGAYEEAPKAVAVAVDDAGLPAGIGSATVALAARAATVADVIPVLADARAVEVRTGVPAMSPDGTFIVDAAPGCDGLWLVAGDNVMGLHVTPAIGEGLAAWITGGGRPDLLAPFGLARFAGRGAEELRADALAQYSAKYQHLDEPAAT